MPTVITHIAPAIALGYGLSRGRVPVAAWALGAALAALPDADAIGFRLGVPYGHVFGHRGFSHGLVFALCVAVCVSLIFWLCTRRHYRFSVLLAYFSIVAVSHGLLDAFTNGGLGVGFFSPFSNHRTFFPARPIAVAPLNIHVFLARWNPRVLESEIVWVLIPCLVLSIVLRAVLGPGTKTEPGSRSLKLAERGEG